MKKPLLVKAVGLGCVTVFCVAILIIVFGVSILPCILPHNPISQEVGKWRMLSSVPRPLSRLMWANNGARESGKEWIDPASCSNSTQFVQMLCEKFKDDTGGYSCDFGPYANVWCVVVNPPEDDSFPLIFTCNIDPRELLCPQDEDQPWKLTCPKTWGGTCFNFCENAAVIGCVGGAPHFLEGKYARSKFISRDGIPKPGPDTYFLTPTGRVDFVERQAQSGTGTAEPS